MNERILEHIQLAAAKTIESMAFAEVYPAEKAIDYSNSDSITVHLEVLEPYNGSLGMRCSSSFITSIAENLFALPAQEITSKQLTDLLNEIINTIAGSFLSAALPSDVSFKLSLPMPGLDENQHDDLNMCVWDFNGEEGDFTLYGAGELIEKL